MRLLLTTSRPCACASPVTSIVGTPLVSHAMSLTPPGLSNAITATAGRPDAPTPTTARSRCATTYQPTAVSATSAAPPAPIHGVRQFHADRRDPADGSDI